jgi:hypothetical protein
MLPVEPSLFDFISDFAEEVKVGKVDADGALEASSPIIAFCEGFFAQFFANELKQPITGFDFDSKRVAAGLAERRRGGDNQKEERSLIALFEKFCGVYTDVISGNYGGGSIAYRAFDADYMRRLLERALRWAERAGYGELVEAIDPAKDVYESAIRRAEW